MLQLLILKNPLQKMKLQNTTPKQIHSSTLHSLALFSIVFLLCQNGSASAHLANQTDQLALLEFMHQTANNLIFNSWNTSLHFCQWKGVECGLRHRRVVGLNLTGQNIFGTVSPHIGNLSFLRFIDLSHNRFHGEIPQQIGCLYRLRHLDLINNTLGGSLPVNLSRCLDLRLVDLSSNHLVGTIPVELGSLKKLNYLDLGSNNFTGFIPISFGNLSSLTQISVRINNIKGTIPSELGRLTNLAIIIVSGNNLTGTIPSSLYNISTITDFWTTQNQLTGTLPANIGLTLPNLQNFGFGRNKFHGEIPGSISNASQLQLLEIVTNEFIGQVPANLGSLQNLQFVNIADNLLGRNATNDLSFITSLSNCTNLQKLFFDTNNFGAEIPNSIGNLSVQLKELALGENHIVGMIPSVIENLAGLYGLGLWDNLLSGPIPSSLGKLQNLQELILKGNKLWGKIPSSLGNITRIFALDLSDNNLEGNIPTSLGNCKKLNQLDLSQNNLIGPIPENVISIFSLSISLNLSRNSLTGSLPVEVGRLKNLNALDVSNNKLTGNIPETIAGCLSLEYLYIQGNFFQGIIPAALAALRGIRKFDLSRNNLSGKIPEDMEKLPYLQYMNLSFNELEGEVPEKGAFGNASAISILGNSKLCGGIKELKLPSCRIKVKKPEVPLAIKVVIIASGAVLFFVLIIISIFLRSRRRRRRTRKDPASVDLAVKRLLRISYHELYRATAGFSPQNLIGSGSFGSVYKGKLDQQEEKLVAVKVLNLQKSGASKSFVAECRALRNVRHRNLVKILTYCSSIDFKGNEFKALVYEFMENGSLDMWLHPQVPESSTTLRLIQKLNIAIDVASAIHYLHDLCEPPIIHCDLKPSNILLDNELTAHVGDFGLATLLSKSADTFAQAQCSSMGIKGSIGYAAPEYGMGGAASKCGDVYSYGVLLLEMLTGRRPTDDMFKDSLNLHNYIKTALQEQIMQIVDQTLVITGEADETESATVEEERKGVNEIEVEQYTINTRSLLRGSDKLQKFIIAVLKIGLACSAESPKERMGMNNILRELQHIKTAFLDDGIVRN